MFGLPELGFLGVEDGPGYVGKLHLETMARSAGCPRSGVVARIKDRPGVDHLVPCPTGPSASCGTGGGGAAPIRTATRTPGPRTTASPRELLTTRDHD